MEKVLITGGLGQLGSYIAERLCREYKVIILDKKSSYTLDVGEIIKGDILDKSPVDKLVARADIVVHAAAQVSVSRSIEEPFFDAENNIIGTMNMLQAARNTRPNPLFIYVSSAAVYGNPVHLPIREDHPQDPLSPYGASKLAGEKYTQAFHRAFGLPTVCVRPFNIYSPRQDPESPYSGVISRFIDNIKQGKPPVIFGDGKQTRDFVSAKDVAELICLLIKNEKAIGQVFNAATGVPTTINHLAETILKLFCSNLEPVHKEPRKGDIRDSYADITKAKEIGYTPMIELKQGLKEMIRQDCHQSK